MKNAGTYLQGNPPLRRAQGRAFDQIQRPVVLLER